MRMGTEYGVTYRCRGRVYGGRETPEDPTERVDSRGVEGWGAMLLIKEIFIFCDLLGMCS